MLVILFDGRRDRVMSFGAVNCVGCEDAEDVEGRLVPLGGLVRPDGGVDIGGLVILDANPEGGGDLVSFPPEGCFRTACGDLSRGELTVETLVELPVGEVSSPSPCRATMPPAASSTLSFFSFRLNRPLSIPCFFSFLLLSSLNFSDVGLPLCFSRLSIDSWETVLSFDSLCRGEFRSLSSRSRFGVSESFLGSAVSSLKKESVFRIVPFLVLLGVESVFDQHESRDDQKRRVMIDKEAYLATLMILHSVFPLPERPWALA